jgi:hypothetical protein
VAQESYQIRKFRQDKIDSRTDTDEQRNSSQKGDEAGLNETRGRDSRDRDEKPKSRNFAKVHYAPKIPTYDVTKDMESGVDVLQVFGKTLATWTEPYSAHLADAMKITMKRIDLQ